MPGVFPERRREQLQSSSGSLATILLSLAALYFGREVFVPLALAGLLAFLLAPAATLLERWGVKRTPAAALVILLSLSSVGALGWVVLGQVYNLAVELPEYQQNLSEKIQALHLNSAGRLSTTLDMLTHLGQQISGTGVVAPAIRAAAPRHRRETRERAAVPEPPPAPAQPIPVKVVEQPQESVLTVAGRTMMPLMHPLTTMFIVVIFLIFMLLGREDLRDRGLRLAGSGRLHVTTTAMEDASRRVSRYLQRQLLVNLGYGTVIGLCLWVIGVPHPLLWAVLTCFLRFVPYIGILTAAAGPLLLSIAASPHWMELVWTMVMYFVLEVVTANFVEPFLYGASTGISAMAILIAAIFWTLLWGLPGLLLSTPLTVCLIVIGRQVPQLRYIEVLFGQEAELSAADRFFQRLLAANAYDASDLLRDMLLNKSREAVYDDVLIPALTQIEEAKHAEEITDTRAEELLQTVEEIAEDLTSRLPTAAAAEGRPGKRLVCVPARDFADEVACHLALQVLTHVTSTRVLSAECSLQEVLRSLGEHAADVVCVIGIPPRALKYVRMRCHQIRSQYPDCTVVACVLSKESELSNLRSRIPTDDAQHVACSLQLMKNYLLSVVKPDTLPTEVEEESHGEANGKVDLTQMLQEVKQIDAFDGRQEDIFGRLAASLARCFDAPIALITVAAGERQFWEAQCGLPEDTFVTSTAKRELLFCSKVTFSDSTLIIPDTAEQGELAQDPFLRDRGIRFYAGAPLRAQDGEVMGSICVLDTRPRNATEEQRRMLVSIADSVMQAIEMHDAGELGHKPRPDSEL